MDGYKGKGRRVKRKQVQSEDGWTVVAGSSSDRAKGVEKPQGSRPTRTVDGLTVERLANEFKDMEKRWQKSSCAKTLDKMLRLKDWSAKEAVCIGIGSLSLDWEHRWRSMWQLVLFIAVVKVLQDHNPAIALYAQEPIFTPLDTAFLSTLSITVLPAGIESQITPTSFVFAPFVDWYILLPVFLKVRDPELYIGNEILGDYKMYANTKEKEMVLEDSNMVGAKFIVGKERRRVPELEEHGSALEGLIIYWRGDVDEDEE